MPLDATSLTRMTDVIAHRGPDEDGHHLAPGVALGMRRLSIIDVAGSHQPVANEDGGVIAVFNGEIYNFRDLRRGLEARGHRLATAGDGETLVHLYEEEGPGFVRHLRGMFALALWDAPRRRLVLARDRMGVKPLYVAERPDGLAFASEVKALIAGGLVTPRLDPMGAELFLAHGFLPSTSSLFAGVRALPPATVLVYEDGAITQERPYWDPWRDAPTDTGRSWADDEQRLLELMRTATRDRMIADVPLGVMLSGGLDSSLITALMAEASTGPVKTFSIGFTEDGKANELADARRVAERLGTDHHELLTSAADHPDLLDEVLWHQEEPVADVSSLGFLLLSRLAREHVTVALSGQGADELLGGYRKHQVAAWASSVRGTPAAPLLRAAAHIAPAGSTLARGAAAVGARDPVDRLLASSRIVAAHERAALLTPEFLQAGAEAAIRGAAEVEARGLAAGRTPLVETLYLDGRLALVDNMLLYFDKMSMAASLEVRVPFMDHDVVEFCFALPDDRRVRRGNRKELLKRASRGLVEDAIIDKPKRGFFHAALGAWLAVHRDELLTRTLLDERARSRGQVQPAAVAELVRSAGERGKKSDQRLLCVLLLELWQRTWTDPGSPGAQLAAAASRPAGEPAAAAS